MILTCPSPGEIKPLLGTGNYTFSVVKFPEITFFVNEVELPPIELGVAEQKTSVNDVPLPGETLTYSRLTCTMTVDERMNNYRAVHAWMVAMGFPQSHQQYKDFLAAGNSTLSMDELSQGFSDATLTILGNNLRPIIQARFVDCFPISLSGIRFSSTNTESTPLTTDITFAYSYYMLNVAT
jgi:hypothetical protein